MERIPKIFRYITVFVVLCFIGVQADIPDAPCAARRMHAKESVVCVCNATYCDTLTREQPVLGTYVAYTSSKSGLRFNKTYGQFREGYKLHGQTLYVLNPFKRYQAIIGFGGAVTDSAAYNWKSLSPEARQRMINSYFSKTGSEYNVIRTPVGGSDFSMRLYAYNEIPKDDYKLSNFSLTSEDLELKIPMIKECCKVATEKVVVFGSTWSPPPWMKDSDAFTEASRLLKQFYQTYADYHCLFAEKYKAAGIELWGFTTTNEPLSGVFPFVRYQSLGFNSTGMGQFIERNMGPTFRHKCSVKNLRIMAVDGQRTVIPIFFNALNVYSTHVMDYIDGIAVHWYANAYTPAKWLPDLIREYPDKFILSTEACEGYMPNEPKVILGSWKRARSYINDITENLRNAVSGWVDWNLCLDTEGGPNWANNFVDSPIIVNAEQDEFYKQPMYYALAHFSKFLPPGSRRIKVVETPTVLDNNEYYFHDPDELMDKYDQVAFLTPRNTIVFIIYNTGKSKTVTIQLGEKQIVITLEEESVTTIEFPYVASSIYDDMPLYVKKARGKY